MLRALTSFCVLYAGYLAVWSTGCALRRRAPGTPLLASTALLELVVLVLGSADAITVVTGVAPDELATHLGYLLVVVAVLPVAVVPAARAVDSGLAGVIAVACLALVALVIRLRMTA